MISVVIPAHNEEHYLPLTLKSLAVQNTIQEFEVIVVNNCSTDKTKEVALLWAQKLKLRVVDEPKQGRGAARAAGCLAAQGDIILSTDADTICPPDWIKTMTSALAGDLVAVTGTCKINGRSKIKNAIFNIFQPFLTVFTRLILGHYWLAGFSAAFSKKAYLESGGFNALLNAMEDIDLGRRVSKVGKISLVTNCPVEFADRRFKNGLAKGLLSYVPPFIQYVRGRESVVLKDVR